ncbi:phosphatidylinositol-specific phospholipase C, X domain protein [Yersinia rochesterensis]|uniref:1-phosphatidylinositol phosphodiesterase n=1 Tax=Yersinia rochesterensis TaxID=1604335 RepID=A0A386HEV7_9GAMM|nr:MULTISPECIES: phosphatidylinositol-specific phospholipase C [Yersinia]AJI86378.1 phosphatidylinositol-specific phospholipase C, X domain protein [Yersinia frederiksenii Y225]CNH34379.1 phosphatidylinositol diacylglycerol-lyase [Yersinia kristensenii]AIN19247.1 phosphatidylinositol-specific phospholipase C, X domain protein [Yersinia rochesterensis]AJJ35596.1 phosphatidylinositol-specific phospholipase C, X domain protein [Yersinia rochesterensis]AYD44139.1 phosphatidylinositol-specific phos
MNMKNWMSRLSDSQLLSQISIPGTHDSASFRSNVLGAGFTQTQTWNIREQLEHGIRFLDARCRLINNVFTMHHGAVFLKQQFGDFLTTCIDFIKRNPTEFIILSVKQEHTTEKSTKGFNEIMQERYINPHNKLFYLQNKIPSIGDVRGKIVLLRRYSGDKVGINASRWKDDATFEIKNKGFNIYVQDNYDGYTALSLHFKRKFIDILLKDAQKKRAQDIYINFTSISGLLTPYSGAQGHHLIDGMNIWFCKQYREKQIMGIIVADFVDVQDGAIIKTVVNSNVFV